MKCCVICLLIDLFRLCFVVCFVTLGSLSNHDGNGSQTVTQKVRNSRRYKLHRSYSNSFNLSNVGDFFRSWISNPGQKSLGQYCNIHIFSVISRFPLKTVHSFRNFLAVLPPPTLYKVETQKQFWIHASNIVCEVTGGVGPEWIGKRPRNESVPRLLSWL